jgi:hypothetical protein
MSRISSRPLSVVPVWLPLDVNPSATVLPGRNAMVTPLPGVQKLLSSRCHLTFAGSEKS